MTERILIYDIENAFNIGGYFGPRYDANIAKIIQHTYVFGFAYKYVGDKTIQSCYIWDFPLYKKEPHNDIEVIKKWCELVQDSDIIVGHNIDGFDTKVMTGRMLVHHLPPISMPQSVDTLKLTKRLARFDSNKLDDLGDVLGFGRKIPTDAELWWGCMKGNEQSQKQMVTYNKQDVKLTEKIYLHLRPFDMRHPNLAVIQNRPEACPRCGEEGSLTASGIRNTKSGQYRRWKCTKCASWSSSRLAEKDNKPNHV